MQDRPPNISSIKNSQILHILIIVIAGFIIYSKSFHNPFQGDDIVNIVISQKKASPIGSRYISFLTFAINYHLGGFNVKGYHLFNLLIHISNSVLIYILLRSVFLTPYFSNLVDYHNSKIIAFIIALLFLTHPIHTTTVYLITPRTASLATFFYLLTIIMYLKARLNILESKAYALYMLLAFVCTVLAMKSKEISFTIPAAITLTEITFFYKKTTRRELIYLFLFFLTFLIIPLNRLDLIDHKGLLGESANLLGQTSLISRYEYLLTQFRVVVDYLKSLFVPINLHWAPYHRLSKSLFEIKTITSFILLLFIFSSAVFMLKEGLQKKKGELSLLAFGIIWFFITISVESSIIPIEDLSLDYRTYLPSIGFFIAISALLLTLMRKSVKYIPILFFFISIIITTYSFASYTRHTVFKSVTARWGDSVEKDPENPLAAFFYGKCLYKKKMYKEALPFLIRASNNTDENFKARLHYRGLDLELSEMIKKCYLNIAGVEK